MDIVSVIRQEKCICVVSFIGVDPYIQYNQNKQVVGGAELEIIDTYAKAYGFMPKLRREPTYDMSSWDVGGQTIIRGMVGSVGILPRFSRLIMLTD